MRNEIFSKVKKIVIFYRQLFQCISNNMMRFILSVIGITLSGVILLYGVLAIDAYYNGKMRCLDDVPRDHLLVKTRKEYGKQLIKNNYVSVKGKSKYFTEDVHVFSYNSKKKKNLAIYTKVIGVEQMLDSIMTLDGYESHIIKTNIKKGRRLEDIDNNKMQSNIVIDEFMANIYFDGDDPINKRISLINEEGEKHSYKIVGVVANSYYSNEQIKNIRKRIKNNSDDEDDVISYNTCVYIPLSIFDENFVNDSDEEISYVVQTKEKRDNIKNNIEQICKGNVSFVDYYSEKEAILQNISVLKNFFIAIFIVIFVLSGLNAMNIYFFSVKERITEIGVRKTYGASGSDIVNQFIMESVLISVIAYVGAFFIVLFLLANTVDISYDILDVDLVVKMKPENLWFPFLVLQFEGILFSIFPSIYASRINIVDALRFE